MYLWSLQYIFNVYLIQQMFEALLRRFLILKLVNGVYSFIYIYKKHLSSLTTLKVLFCTNHIHLFMNTFTQHFFSSALSIIYTLSVHPSSDPPFGVQHLAQGPFEMQTGGAGDWSTEPLIVGLSSLPLLCTSKCSPITKLGKHRLPWIEKVVQTDRQGPGVPSNSIKLHQIANI